MKCPLKTVASSWSPFCYRTTAKLAGGVATKLTRLVPLASCAEDPSMTLVWWKKEGTYCNAQSMGKIKPNTVTMEDFLHPTFMNKSFRPYGKKKSKTLHCSPNGSNRHLQNIPSHNCRIHSFHQNMDIVETRPYIRSQNKCQ